MRKQRDRLKWPGLAALGCALTCLGCKENESARWLINGLVDPTQVGQFFSPKRNEIRSVLSILEEPVGIQNAEEPTPEDLLPNYAEEKIAPGDTITISIYELLSPGLMTDQQFRVNNSGYETLPVLGRIRVVGFTPRELELELQALLRAAEILDEAEVHVVRNAASSLQYSIVGAVTRPGTYALFSPEYRLMNAVAEAGGIPPQIEKVYVFRRGAYGPPLSAETQPAVPVSLSLTDVSSGPSTSRSSRPAASYPPTSVSAPSGSLPAVRGDELEQLEGPPEVEAKSWIWDSVRGEWVAGKAAPLQSPGPGETVPAEGEELGAPIRIIEIPVKELMEGDPRYNIVLRPYDLISVPLGSVGEYYMMGNIARPGAYNMTGRRPTVKEAIASSGGFGPLAWPSHVDLVRRVSADEEQLIQLDLDAIFAGNAPDLYLKPNDIINVGSSPAATFLAVLRNAFRFSYGFGFVYDRNFADADSFGAREQVRARRTAERLQRGLPP